MVAFQVLEEVHKQASKKSKGSSSQKKSQIQAILSRGQISRSSRIKSNGSKYQANHGKKPEGSLSPPIKKAWKTSNFHPKTHLPSSTIPKSLRSRGVAPGAWLSCEVPRYRDALGHDYPLPLGSISEDGVSTHTHERTCYDRHGLATIPSDKSFGGFFGYHTYS